MAAEERSPAKGPRQTILIVDDEEMICDLCARALSQYRILRADNGSSALEVLRDEPADLVLADIMMPQLNGLELLESIKELSPNQVVVMMTGFSNKEVILRALKSGADDFIQKPINLLQLQTTVARALEKKALREELIELKRMDHLKAQFLGLISHKLKTPITVISLFIQNLAREMDSSVDPAFRYNLQLILEESEHLGNLIHDLLSFSQIILDNEPGELQEVGTQDLVASCLLEFRDRATGRGIQVVLDPPAAPLPVLLVDRPRILFALRAVVDNAVKFTPAGGRVRVSCRHADDALVIEVQDNGPGIPPEEQPKIFEKFYQVDPDRTGQVRGFGLGLFYARQFTQEHGGSLVLRSTPGLGTSVTLLLPC